MTTKPTQYTNSDLQQIYCFPYMFKLCGHHWGDHTKYEVKITEVLH